MDSKFRLELNICSWVMEAVIAGLLTESKALRAGATVIPGPRGCQWRSGKATRPIAPQGAELLQPIRQPECRKPPSARAMPRKTDLRGRSIRPYTLSQETSLRDTRSGKSWSAPIQ